MSSRSAADAGLHLLDRQIVDKDGKFAGNVDDLELTVPDEGDPPFVSAILCGPEALGRRIGGPLGRWMQAAQARLRPADQDGPARIPFGMVKRIVQQVELGVSADDLAVTQLDRWVEEHIIGKIPGQGMRLSDILECDMVDDQGERIGRVHDVRLIRQGPPQGMFGPSYQIAGLIVGRSAVGARLGFDRADVKGPWPLKKLFGRARNKREYVDWDAVESVEEGLVRLKAGKEALHEVPPLPNE